MNDLTKQAEYRADFKPVQRWSEEHKSYQSDSYNRLFDNIVSGGHQKVEYEKEREAKLESFRNQRVRGKERVNDNS